MNNELQTKLQSIVDKFSNVEYNANNYDIGGGLVRNKFASNRHEDAKNDSGKLTLGEVNQMFKKITGLETSIISDIIKHAIPNMEWHHAGKLPKSYGGGMKKTYFLKADEIVTLAKDWNSFVETYQLSKSVAETYKVYQANLSEKKEKFLNKYATKVVRVEKDKLPKWFVETIVEMNGKYGWFDAAGRDYNMTKYYSGWQFKSKKKLTEYFELV